MKRSAELQRRTSLVTRTPLVARVGLRARSRKMARRYVERRQFVERILTARPFCAAQIEGMCTGRSSTVHEIVGRGVGGPIVPSDGLDPRDVAALCGPCHDYVTTHPAWARSAGWLRFSWEAR